MIDRAPSPLALCALAALSTCASACYVEMSEPEPCAAEAGDPSSGAELAPPPPPEPAAAPAPAAATPAASSVEVPLPEGKNQHVVRSGAEPYGPCPPSLPKPCEMAVLEGDPRSETLFTTRFRVKKGFLLPPHFHGKAERVTIVSGKVGVGFGDLVDKSKGQLFGPGDHYINAPQAHHFVWAEEDSVIQVHGIGPWSATLVETPKAEASQP